MARFPTWFAEAVLVTMAAIAPLAAASKGGVSIAFDLNNPMPQTYACVFSGVVTCRGHACAGAHVRAEISPAGRPSMIQTVDTDREGHYSLQVLIEGAEQDETLWKLSAKPSMMGAEPSEVEGRLILLSETTVIIDRTLHLDGDGV